MVFRTINNVSSNKHKNYLIYLHKVAYKIYVQRFKHKHRELHTKHIIPFNKPKKSFHITNTQSYIPKKFISCSKPCTQKSIIFI